MWNKIKQRFRLYRSIRFLQYIYLNHFCKSVIRTDQSHIIPYKNAILDLAPSCKIYVGGGDLEIGCDRLKSSKAETLVRLRKNAIWSNCGGCRISYGATIELLENALLDTKFFTVNSNSVLITAKRVQLGQDVMLARNVVVFDSDHHAIRNSQDQITNHDEPVCIGNHVWCGANATVLKGTVISDNCMIGANTTVHGTIPAGSMCYTTSDITLRSDYGSWSREHPQD